SINLFRREHATHGGPVTFATIRFPPPRLAVHRQKRHGVDSAHFIKSLGRVVLSRGGWIESHALCPLENPNRFGSSCSGSGNGASCSDDVIIDKASYRAQAFHDPSFATPDDVTFESVHGMIFPSSYSSLSHFNDLSDSRKDNSWRNNDDKSSSTISVVAYGGRRLSFLAGGGLWSSRHQIHSDTSTNLCNDITPNDNFALIPIVSHAVVNGSRNCTNAYLQLSDSIHDAAILDFEWKHSPEKDHQDAQSASIDNKNSEFLMALGMVNNNCEIWGFRSTFIHDRQIQRHRMAFQATRLQCITCNVRCMTYSLCFHGWNDGQAAQLTRNNGHLPALIAASGTIFGEIIVWGIVHEKRNGNVLMDIIVNGWISQNISRDAPTSRLRVPPSYRLKGHFGSVFSVKFGSEAEIASTSDDRTVRLWTLTPSSSTDVTNRECVRNASRILELQSTHSYTLSWTGWGHTARVWDVSFAHSPKDNSMLLLSAGEDGVARIWSPFLTEKEFRLPLRGHRCESLWTVDNCEGIVVTGGNDGSVKLWDLESRTSDDGAKAYLVPSIGASTSGINSTIETEDATTGTRKKKHKKFKAKSQICGMQFFAMDNDEFQSKLLVATREGSLFSLDLTHECWTTHSSWSKNVISSVTGDHVDVDSSTGACIAVRPCGSQVVVGTTEGLLISSDISCQRDSRAPPQNLAFNSTSHRPVHSISQDLYVGDSRGNLAYFTLNVSLAPHNVTSTERSPDSLLARVHAKEHITGVVVLSSTGAIFSVGNDGCVNQCKKGSMGRLYQVFSIPIANVTGLRSIWSTNDGIIVGGYYGNDYVVTDVLNGYEFLRIPTGGRQRRHEFVFNPPNNMKIDYSVPSSYGMAVCTGENSIEIHSRWRSEKTDFRYSHNVGNTLHGETINRLCWVECKGCCAYLLSGSNDCTVKLSRFKDNRFVSVKDLPPHESCVRGVCSSSHPKSKSSLLVTCGGKLSMEFYLLDHESCADGDPASVSFLCSYRTLGTSSIDHRMNVVRAVPLVPSEPYSHMVVAADSDGDIHIVVISEVTLLRKTTIGKILHGNGRPVLCLDLLHFLDRILVFVGTTAGEIMVWDLPSRVNFCSGDGRSNCIADAPYSPLYTVNAHSSGVNDLSVAIADKAMPVAVLCSVGDDQTLATYVFTFVEQASCEDRYLELSESKSVVGSSPSSSPLKSVKVVCDDSSLCFRVYTTGQDECITLWRLEFQPLAIKLISSSALSTEGSCIDCIQITYSNGSEHEMIAIGGEGIELQSIDLSVIKAAKKLYEANYLLITAGAGFSADSGLSTYECAPDEYKELCDPSKLIKEARRFQQFWLNFSHIYSKTKPHVGYEFLDQWCSGGLMPNLKKYDKNDVSRTDFSPWWVYTSNVDCHFRRFKSFQDSICEIHGSADEYICSCRIGYSGGQARIGMEWCQWNQGVPKFKSCKQTRVQVTFEALKGVIKDNTMLLCESCQLPLRPNVLMFNDTDENVLSYISTQRNRYQAWESHVEDAISNEKSKFVILELGCGVNVPAVRQESEEVLSDCAQIIQYQERESKGSVCLVRINPKNAEVDQLGHGAEYVSVEANAKKALEQIHHILKQMTK
ncbi:hypothetical protein ACHAWX_004784, partial [Stephanocyclus meneghinianus]